MKGCFFSIKDKNLKILSSRLISTRKWNASGKERLFLLLKSTCFDTNEQKKNELKFVCVFVEVPLETRICSMKVEFLIVESFDMSKKKKMSLKERKQLGRFLLSSFFSFLFFSSSLFSRFFSRQWESLENFVCNSNRFSFIYSKLNSKPSDYSSTCT